jgi:ATP-dependent Clp protease ATP-binding subunit ClpX
MVENALWAAAEHYVQVCLSSSRPLSAGQLASLYDLVGFLGGKLDVSAPRDITPWHTREYIRELERTDLSAKEARIARATALRFLRFLLRNQMLPASATDHLPSPGRSSTFRKPSTPSKRSQLATQPPDAEPQVADTIQAHDLPTVPTHTHARDVKRRLDERVVGQESAKIQLSVLFSMHLNWFEQQHSTSRSPDAILIGPTGVGKTHTLRTAAEYLGIPFLTVDSTSLVPAGIVGIQIEDVLADLVRLANDLLDSRGVTRTDNDDIELARRGAIFFDEFDKIAARAEGQSFSDNYAIQRRLLKLVEGSVLGVGVRQHQSDSMPLRSMDTAGILVLAGGAFAGIDENRIRSKRSDELKRELSKTTANTIVSADIVNYGFMPELVARLPVLIDFTSLGDADLLRILEIAEISPLQVWVDHFKALGTTLELSPSARQYVAKTAASLHMGARGLHQVLFPSLASLAYEIESAAAETFTLTPEHFAQRKMLAR